MARGDVDLVRSAYDAYARGDLAVAASAYSEDTVWDVSRFRPDVRVHRGLGELGQSLATWRETWDDHFFSVEDVIDAGDRVVVVIREGGVGKESRAHVAIRYGHVVTVRDGQITETIVYRDPDEAFEAAGIPPG